MDRSGGDPARGGRGGPATSTSRTATNQTRATPSPANPARSAGWCWRLKVLGRRGPGGLPNARQEHLLAITAAKPKTADYSLHHAHAQPGHRALPRPPGFVMADIPASSKARQGIGLRFLRHIERNSGIAVLGAQPADEPDVSKHYNVLLEELKALQPGTAAQDRLLAISKSDLLDEELMAELEQTSDVDHLFISAVSPGQAGHAEGPALAAVADGARSPLERTEPSGRYEPGPLAGRCGHRPVPDPERCACGMAGRAHGLDRSEMAFWFPLYASSSSAPAALGWRGLAGGARTGGYASSPA